MLEIRIDEIRHVTGISSLVHFGKRIPAVPDEAIAELKQSFESEAPMLVEDGVVPGAEATIVEGSFMGFSGRVVRTLSAGQRVQILLDFLGRVTFAEIDRKSLIVENQSAADRLPLLATSGFRCHRGGMEQSIAAAGVSGGTVVNFAVLKSWRKIETRQQCEPFICIFDAVMILVRCCRGVEFDSRSA